MRQGLGCISEWTTTKALHWVSSALNLHIQQHMHSILMRPLALGLAYILTMQTCSAVNQCSLPSDPTGQSG